MILISIKYQKNILLLRMVNDASLNLTSAFACLDISGGKAPSWTASVDDVTVMVSGQEDGELSRQRLRVIRGHSEHALIGAVVKAGW